MASNKVDTEKKKRDMAKICHESEELKELQQKIRLAYLNKERSAQITEDQFRKQIDLVSFNFLFVSLIVFISPTLAKRRRHRHRIPQKKGTCR